MTRAASLVALAAVLSLPVPMSCATSAMTVPRMPSPGAAVVPAASSDAHRGIGGRYGGYKALAPNPGSKTIGPKSRSLKNIGPGGFEADSKTGAGKQPYPYPYYYDTSRGNYGCNRYARRAIETDNANWWARYRACTEARDD